MSLMSHLTGPQIVDTTRWRQPAYPACWRRSRDPQPGGVLRRPACCGFHDESVMARRIAAAEQAAATKWDEAVEESRWMWTEYQRKWPTEERTPADRPVDQTRFLARRRQ